MRKKSRIEKFFQMKGGEICQQNTHSLEKIVTTKGTRSTMLPIDYKPYRAEQDTEEWTARYIRGKMYPLNILNKTNGYSVGAMEFENGESWRNKAETELAKMGIVLFNPYKKPFETEVKEDSESQEKLKQLRKSGNLNEVHRKMREIVAVDLAMVDRADFIVAKIDPTVPTFGSIHELVVANMAKKPVFIFVEGGVEKTPLWLLGMFKPRHFYNSLDEVLDTIRKINKGEIELSSNRWRLMKPEFR